MAWNVNGTPNTLGTAGTELDITDLTAKKFNVFLNHITTSTAHNIQLTYENNSNSVYSTRTNSIGGSDTTTVNTTNVDSWSFGTGDEFMVHYNCSISGEEKLTMTHQVVATVTGSGTSPARTETIHKFVPSPDTNIERIDLHSTSGNYLSTSNLTAFGTD
tara:strand:- start:531 stop:1010 length:480 start_codon:yes stop_codon:yes gene_type:complete